MTRATQADQRLADGTSGQGSITATLRTLLKIFGQPNGQPSDKTTVEWVLQFENGTIATVYDWKRYELGTPEMDERTDWEVGGHDHDAYEQVRRAVRLG
jgi:hypothetical protein